MARAPSERKRLVILTRDDFAHRYVVNTLCAAFEIDRIVVDRQPYRANVRRAMRRGFRHFLSKTARWIFLKAARDRAARALTLRRLVGNEGKAFHATDKI